MTHQIDKNLGNLGKIKYHSFLEPVFDLLHNVAKSRVQMHFLNLKEFINNFNKKNINIGVFGD